MSDILNVPLFKRLTGGDGFYTRTLNQQSTEVTEAIFNLDFELLEFMLNAKKEKIP